MPFPSASLGCLKLTDFPSIMIFPVSREYIPVSIFISVDFPAPFSPTSACISPLPRLKLTSFSTCTPEKFLLIPDISIRISFLCFQLKRVFSTSSRAGMEVAAPLRETEIAEALVASRRDSSIPIPCATELIK